MKTCVGGGKQGQKAASETVVVRNAGAKGEGLFLLNDAAKAGDVIFSELAVVAPALVVQDRSGRTLQVEESWGMVHHLLDHPEDMPSDLCRNDAFVVEHCVSPDDETVGKHYANRHGKEAVFDLQSKVVANHFKHRMQLPESGAPFHLIILPTLACKMNMDPEHGNVALRVPELHGLDPWDVLGRQQGFKVQAAEVVALRDIAPGEQLQLHTYGEQYDAFLMDSALRKSSPTKCR
jgi:hypothetical protein